MRRFFLSIIFFYIAFSSLLAQNRVHEVQAGETLYSISRKYGVSVSELRQANTQIGENIMAGQTLQIPVSKQSASTTSIPTESPQDLGKPQCKQMYLVEKKETIYSITHKFGITEAEFRAANPDITKDKVKKGQYVCIPYTAEEQTELARRQAEEQAERAAELQRQAEAKAREALVKNTVNVALILPFGLDDAKKSKEAVKMLDFYQGFLLGVEEMKAKGLNVNIYAYDEKDTYSSTIDSILSMPMMQHQDLIVGPMRREHIPALARFAHQKSIPLVIPFSTRAAAIAGTAETFQVNTQPSQLYSEVYKAFLQTNAHANIVFLYQTEGKDTNADYIIHFKEAIKSEGLTYRTAESSDPNSLTAALDSVRPNVIIPSSANQTAFVSLAKLLDKIDSPTTYRIALFGYPEWQTFKDANLQLLRKYNASFFSTFHTAPLNSAVQNFDRKFRLWYQREQSQTVPRYGLLGYDISRYFLTGVHQFGTEFPRYQTEIHVDALQNPMQFVKQNNGAYVNTSIRIIRL